MDYAAELDSPPSATNVLLAADLVQLPNGGARENDLLMGRARQDAGQDPTI